MADGEFSLESKPLKGTKLNASFNMDHINRIPPGDIAETAGLLIKANPNISWLIRFTSPDDEFILDTDEIKHQLDGVPMEDNNVLEWIQNTKNKGVQSFFGGVLDEVG